MKLAVVGVGLIGGSWAKALKERALVTEVLGVDRSEQHLSVFR
jgi:prephenate dehydrogenase